MELRNDSYYWWKRSAPNAKWQTVYILADRCYLIGTKASYDIEREMKATGTFGSECRRPS